MHCLANVVVKLVKILREQLNHITRISGTDEATSDAFSGIAVNVAVLRSSVTQVVLALVNDDRATDERIASLDSISDLIDNSHSFFI